MNCAVWALPRPSPDGRSRCRRSPRDGRGPRGATPRRRPPARAGAPRLSPGAPALLPLGIGERLVLRLERVLQFQHADVHGKRRRHDRSQVRLAQVDRAADDLAGHRHIDRVTDRIRPLAVEQRRGERHFLAQTARSRRSSRRTSRIWCLERRIGESSEQLSSSCGEPPARARPPRICAAPRARAKPPRRRRGRAR